MKPYRPPEVPAPLRPIVCPYHPEVPYRSCELCDRPSWRRSLVEEIEHAVPRYQREILFGDEPDEGHKLAQAPGSKSVN